MVNGCLDDDHVIWYLFPNLHTMGQKGNEERRWSAEEVRDKSTKEKEMLQETKTVENQKEIRFFL